MKKQVMLLGFSIINGVSAGFGEARKIPIIRRNKPQNEKVSLYGADERVIASVVNGVIGKVMILSTMAAIEERLNDDFYLPGPRLPLQK